MSQDDAISDNEYYHCAGNRIVALKRRILRLEEELRLSATSLAEMIKQRDTAILEASRAISALKSIGDSAHLAVIEAVVMMGEHPKHLDSVHNRNVS